MSRHAFISILITAAIAACGSKSTPRSSPASNPAEPPMMAGAGSTTGSAETHPIGEPAPIEHAKPVEKEPVPVPPDPATLKADLLAAETTAWETAKPVFDKACAGCHTKSGKKAAKKKLDQFDMTTYPLGGQHSGTIGITIREVLGISGKKATMPKSKPGSVKGDDLAKITLWTDAWEASKQGGAHPSAAAEHH